VVKDIQIGICGDKTRMFLFGFGLTRLGAHKNSSPAIFGRAGMKYIVLIECDVFLFYS
jgi:hypothetical protein